MGDPLVDQNQLEQIGSYVKTHIGEWIREQNIYPFPPPREDGIGKELLERIVTVEQQLKFQNEKLELMMRQSDQRFGAIEKRFEEQNKTINQRFEEQNQSINHRFEAMDKRFTLQTWIISSGFVVMGTLITVFKFLN